jgi:Domain of unknown function (DUF4055)
MARKSKKRRVADETAASAVGMSSNSRSGVSTRIPDAGMSFPDPSAPSSAHLQMRPMWDIVRTCWGGTLSVRAAGEKFLPRYSRESKEEWQRRLNMTTFYNVFADAVVNTASRPFAKPLTVRDTSHPFAGLLAEDIDTDGTRLSTFGRRQFRDALIDGMVHTLIDYVFVPEGSTLADVRQAGARPYFVHVPAQQLLAAYTSFRGGRRIVTHARILESHTYLQGFKEVTRKRVRVLEPGSYQLWELVGQGWQVIEEGDMVRAGGALWDRVPLETFYVGSNETDFHHDPPFLDLALKNLEHWQSSSDQRNILTKSRFPILAASGMDAASLEDRDPETGKTTGSIVLGPHSVLVSEDAHAKWYYVEPRGSAIEQGHKDLQNLENQMLAMGVEPIRARQNNQITATQTGVDEIKARSILEQWAFDYVDYMERCFLTAFEWMGIYDAEIEIDLPTDFSGSGNPATEIDTLLKARAQGDLSRPTLWEEMKRRNFLSAHFDADKERGMIEEDSMIGAQNTAIGTFLNSKAIQGELPFASGTPAPGSATGGGSEVDDEAPA